MYKNWLEERGEDFRSGIQIATLDPFQGYKNAIDDQLQDATSVLDAFHIVKLAGDALDEVRRRVQQDTTGHRGRTGDPLYQIRLLLCASRHRLTPRQKERLREAFTADEAHTGVEVAYLGRTLRKWKDALGAYFDTGGASNGPTEAINGIIEFGRRISRGCCNPTNYGLCRLLITAGTRPLNEMSTTPA